MRDNPIGIFDSGVGGTSIWKEVVALLPNESTIYLADSINAPYGTKSKEKILELSKKNTEILLEKEAKTIIVACNTATTNAISFLREKYDVPFIGIEPAIKPAALQTQTKKVGVLATKGTLSSHLFHNTSKLHAQGIEVIEKEGTGLVELIEAGKHADLETEQLLKKILRPMFEAKIDCLVLGCTHYPYLYPLLKKIAPEHVQIIDSGFAVAKQTKAVLEKHDLVRVQNNKSHHLFYTNGNVEVLNRFVGKSSEVRYLEF